MQNKKIIYQLRLLSAMFVLIVLVSCSSKKSTDTSETILTPVTGISETKISISGSDFWFVKVPLVEKFVWVTKFELTNSQFTALSASALASDSANYPKVLNWFDAARFCNRFTKILGDTALSYPEFSTVAATILPLYGDTSQTLIYSPESVFIASYAAAFPILPSDSFSTTGNSRRLRIVALNSHKSQLAMIDSVYLSATDTAKISSLLAMYPDSLYASSSSIILSIRKHIRRVAGPAYIDTMLLDTIIKALDHSTDSVFTLKTFRHILLDSNNNQVSPALPARAVLLPTSETPATWHAVYFASVPHDTIINRYPGVLLPVPCTLSVEAQPVTVKLWHRDSLHTGLRLPTLFEWEQIAICGSYALRYSTNTGNLNSSSAVYGSASSREISASSSREPNPNGIIDMTGNMFEWVEDWHIFPYKGLKGGFFGSAANDSSLVNLNTTAANPDLSYNGKTGGRFVITSTPAIDSLLKKLNRSDPN